MHQPSAAPSLLPILLADDQPASRDAILRVLGNLGHATESISTTREVLRQAGSSELALILLSTTFAEPGLLVEIRRGAGAVPIAMIGPPLEARDAYQAAGVIEFLERPINSVHLRRLVERACAAGAGDHPSRGAPDPVIDLDHLFGFTDGDPQLEGELLTLFLSSADVYLARMDAALRTGQDWGAPAHSLKGASANLGARRVTGLALAAERSPPSEDQLEALRRAVEEVRTFGRSRPNR